MTHIALDLERAMAAMSAHDTMITVIADVRAVLPRFIVPPTTRVLYGQDEDGEPFLTIALPDQRVSIYVDAGRLDWHAIVRGELGTSAVPSEEGSVDFGAYSAGTVSDIVHFGAYSAEALPDILSLLFDEAPLCIMSTQTMGAHGSPDRPADPGDLQPQARLCRAAGDLLDLGLEGDDNVRAALAERDRRPAPILPPPPTKPSIGVLVNRSLMDRVEELTTQLREQAIELTAQLREQAMHLDERQARIEDLERTLGRVEAERQGLADQLARPPLVRAMEQALLRDLSRADLPEGHYVPRYGPNAVDNMVSSDGHVVLATGDGEQGSDILYLSIYPAARDVAGRSRVQSAKLSAVARLLWNASRLVNARTR